MPRRELTLEAALSRLDIYYLLILDELACVTRDQAETSVLVELIVTRYERRSLISHPDRRAIHARLNASWFLSMADAHHKIEAWRTDCNEDRSHLVLGNWTQSAFATLLEST